ncbi:19389_t:CDS:2, partial [Gigaspora margarita]
ALFQIIDVNIESTEDPIEIALNRYYINDIYMINPNLDQPNLLPPTWPLENEEED